MHEPIKLAKSDARRAMVRYQFATAPTLDDAFNRLKCVQFDPIAPVGCNHDLVLQARVPEYKVGDWMPFAYEQRKIYDGWDKQASLVPYETWPLHRLFHHVHRGKFEDSIFKDHADAVDYVLKELTERGPMMPRDFEMQVRKEEWAGSWLGPSLVKNVLRALWHSGQVMTSGRKGGQHVYDLTERLVPPHLFNQPVLPVEDATRELVLERHRSMGMVKPNASFEIWSYAVLAYTRKPAIDDLVASRELIPVDVEGMKANATPEFLELLDQPSIDRKVTFVAPLDQLMWDRKMVAHLFNFDYSWEIYTPEAKRRWGYYVLPILFGDDLVARVEFYCREGVLELREWHFEAGDVDPEFLAALEPALAQFMTYASAKKIKVERGIDARIRSLAKGVKPVRK